MEYRTVFDVAESGYTAWRFLTPGLILSAVGGVLVARRNSLPGWWGRHPGVSAAFSFCFFGIAVLVTVVGFLSTYARYAALSRARSANDVQVVEGPVTGFTPMPAAGHAMERFCVARVCFEYSDFQYTGGFNNTSSHGGPIRQGLPVRVSYVGGTIVKLEVGQ